MLPKRFCTLQVNERSWEGLRVSFRIDKFKDRSLNAASIEVFGLSRDSISEFQKPKSTIRLFAGYNDGRNGLIFFGNPIKSGVRINENSITIEATDTSQALQKTFINETFPAGTRLETVIDRLVLLLGIPKSFFQLPKNVVFAEGLVLSGRLADALDTLSQSAESEWFITDGAFNFVPQGFSRDTGLLISSRNKNLIGSPAPRDDNKIEVTTLLEPALKPAGRVSLDSEFFKGNFSIEEVSHEGDTHNNPWYTNLTLERLKK
jgi:hypothetical protein